jgi:hypothetical protein
VADGRDEEVMEHKEKGKVGEALGVEQNKTFNFSLFTINSPINQLSCGRRMTVPL